MKKQAILFFIPVFIFSCNNAGPTGRQEDKADTAEIKSKPFLNSEEKETTPKQQENPYKNSRIDVTTFKNQDGSWGYSITLDGHLYINQPNVPSLPGNEGFKTIDAAKKTGELVAYKIHNNIMPPSITVNELDSLGLLNR